MTLPSELQWLDGVAVSVVACDTAGVCTYINERACQMFAKDGGRALLGRSLIDCHPEPARSRLLDLLRTPRANSYTVEKAGKKSSSIRRPSRVRVSSPAWSKLLSSCQSRCRTSCADSTFAG